MQSFAVLALVVASSTSALAAKHQLYTGFFAGSTVVALEFDDVTSSLAIINNISTTYTSGQKWIALDVSVFRAMILRMILITYLVPSSESICSHGRRLSIIQHQQLHSRSHL